MSSGGGQTDVGNTLPRFTSAVTRIASFSNLAQSQILSFYTKKAYVDCNYDFCINVKSYAKTKRHIVQHKDMMYSNSKDV